MPELPEVETVVRGLKKHIIGQAIKDVEVLNKKSFKGTKPKGLKIKSIIRRGKGIVIELSKDKTLLIHLKMTGQLIWIPTPLRRKGYGGLRRLNLGHPTDDFNREMPSSHTRVIFKLPKGTLYFNDQRLFGWVKVLPTKELKNDPFIKKLGPEALNISTAHLLSRCQKRPQSSIKALLLDQSVITGLGNIYSDEVLFEAGIRPTRKGKTITKHDIEKLIKAIKKVLEKGIKYSGTSIVNYKTPEGSPGRMQNYLKVYSRGGLPCRRCKTSITKTRLAGRGTHYCRICQT